MANAGKRRGASKPRGRPMIDLIVKRTARAEPALRSGEMDDRIDARQQWLPVERLAQVRMLNDLDVFAECRIGEVPDRCANMRAARDQSRDRGATEEARCAG